MNERCFLALALYIICSVMAIAQMPSPTQPPRQPFVTNAPICGQWTISFTSIGTTASQAPNKSIKNSPLEWKLKEIKVVKVYKDRYEIDSWSDGQTSEKWFHEDRMIFTRPGSPEIYILERNHLNGAMAQVFPDYRASDFPELGWLNLSVYVGVQTLQNRACYVFQSKKVDSLPPRNPEDAMNTEAWIDMNTKLPLAISDGMNQQIFAFQNLSPGTLKVPARLVQALQRYESTEAGPAKYQMKL